MGSEMCIRDSTGTMCHMSRADRVNISSSKFCVSTSTVFRGRHHYITCPAFCVLLTAAWPRMRVVLYQYLGLWSNTGRRVRATSCCLTSANRRAFRDRRVPAFCGRQQQPGVRLLAPPFGRSLVPAMSGGIRVFHQYKDCLLYTSPSPRDGLLSRMPSSA